MVLGGHLDILTAAAFSVLPGGRHSKGSVVQRQCADFLQPSTGACSLASSSSQFCGILALLSSFEVSSLMEADLLQKLCLHYSCNAESAGSTQGCFAFLHPSPFQVEP